MHIDKYIGHRHVMITIIGYDHTDRQGVYVKYACDCGKVKVTRLPRALNIQSCGCYKPYQVTHGMYGTKLYKVYDAIKQRVQNPNHKFYKDYGGRGIICEWDTFEQFYTDMGTTYSEGLSIDRIDNNLGYSKENCRWIPMDAQQRNRRNNIVYSIGGLSMCLSEWSRYLSLSRYKVQRLLQKGGSQIDFIMLMDGCDIKTAITKLSHF